MGDRVVIPVDLDGDGTIKGAREAEKGLDRVGTAGERAGNIASKGLDKIKIAAAAAGAAMLVAAKKSIDAAVNLNESINAINVVFGEASEEVLKIGANADQSMGLSQRSFNEAAVQFSAFAQTIAGEGGNAAAVVGEMTQRAADFASVHNIEVSDALTLFQSGLAGETEALRRYGILLSAANVENFAYANGVAEAGAELTEQQKVIARYRLLLEETNVVAGDFANTSDSVANTERRVAAEVENLAAKMGTRLLPIKGELLQVTGDVLDVLEDLFDRMEDSGAIDRLGDAFSDLLTNLQNLSDAIADADEDFLGFETVVDQVNTELDTLNAILNEISVELTRIKGLATAAGQALQGNLAGASLTLQQMRHDIGEIRSSTDDLDESARRTGASFEESGAAIAGLHQSLQVQAGGGDLFTSLLEFSGQANTGLEEVTVTAERLKEELTGEDGGTAAAVKEVADAAEDSDEPLNFFQQRLKEARERAEAASEAMRSFQGATDAERQALQFYNRVAEKAIEQTEKLQRVIEIDPSGVEAAPERKATPDLGLEQVAADVQNFEQVNQSAFGKVVGLLNNYEQEILNIQDSLLNVSDALMILSDRQGIAFKIAKGIAVAEAVINTLTGVTKALAQGGFFGFTMAASVATAGFAQVARILATEPNESGGSPSGGSGGGISVTSATAPGVSGTSEIAAGLALGTGTSIDPQGQVHRVQVDGKAAFDIQIRDPFNLVRVVREGERLQARMTGTRRE